MLARARGENTLQVYGEPAANAVSPADLSEGWPVVWIFDTEGRDDCEWTNLMVPMAWLKPFIDVDAVTNVWEKAISSKWSNNPVWIHGDFSVGNILVKDDRLTAVIDFGCMGIGDPACDLVIAWTFLTRESRKIFRSHLGLDPDTWARARGWALWKSLITRAPLEDKACSEALKRQQVIDEILDES